MLFEGFGPARQSEKYPPTPHLQAHFVHQSPSVVLQSVRRYILCEGYCAKPSDSLISRPGKVSALVKLVFIRAEGNVSKQARQCCASETYKVLWKLTVQSPALFSGVGGGKRKVPPRNAI